MKRCRPYRQLELGLLGEDGTLIGDSLTRIPAKRPTETNGLTRGIIAFLRSQGWQAERISVVGIAKVKRDGQGNVNGVEWKKSQMQAGTADISATIAGRSVKIEIKVGTDRQSEAQKQYQKQVEEAGGIYYVARNYDDFVKWYNEQWKPRNT